MERTITKKKKFLLPGGEVFEFRDDLSCGRYVLFGVESENHAVYAKSEHFCCVLVGISFFLKPFAFETVRLNPTFIRPAIHCSSKKTYHHLLN